MKEGKGSLSPKLVISSQFVEKIPEFYSPKQAAGLTLVGLTALELADHTERGDRVLVAGGSTSVGLLLIKMLKAKGCSLVVATGSGSKLDVIKSRGADDVVDCECLFPLSFLFSLLHIASFGSKLTSQLCFPCHLSFFPDRASDFPKELASRYSKQPFDVVLDTVGDQLTHSGCGSYLKEGGHYFNCGASVLTPNQGGVFKLISFLLSAFLLPTFLGGVPAKFHNTSLQNEKFGRFAALARGESMKRKKKFPNLRPNEMKLLFLMRFRVFLFLLFCFTFLLYSSTEIDLDPLIDSTFPFAEAPKAYQRLTEGRALGKIVVEVK